MLSTAYSFITVTCSWGHLPLAEKQAMCRGTAAFPDSLHGLMQEQPSLNPSSCLLQQMPLQTSSLVPEDQPSYLSQHLHQPRWLQRRQPPSTAYACPWKQHTCSSEEITRPSDPKHNAFLNGKNNGAVPKREKPSSAKQQNRVQSVWRDVNGNAWAQIKLRI